MAKPKNPWLFALKWTEGEPVFYGTHITLRDLFAGLCAAGQMVTRDVGDNHDQIHSFQYRWAAKHSYALADALLAERAKEQQ
jgi:hypothetical protein